MTKLPYRAPYFFRQGHVATLVSHFLRRSAFAYHRTERLATPDEDFIAVDRYEQDSGELGILLHGLEGSSRSPYILNMASAAAGMGMDVAALNFRSCGGEMNTTARFYHSGETSDLEFLIDKLLESGRYHSVFLVGFSLGGNMLLKYLGEKGKRVPAQLRGAMSVSAPVDLTSSARQMEKLYNRFYLNRFLNSLKFKVRQKMLLFPDAADWERGLRASGFFEFDDAVTAPLHGFQSVYDYYTRASSLPHLEKIRVPTLLLNARNDSFLSDRCYPTENLPPDFIGNYPAGGGHVGFPLWPLGRSNFTERQFRVFVESV